MIDNHFIKYGTYSEYKADISNIPDTSFVFIESPKMIVTRGLEFRCVGTMTVSEVQNLSPDVNSISNKSGLYLLTRSDARQTCGWVFMHSDYFNHTFEQIVFSNMVLYNGELDGTHEDGAFNLCYRSYSISSTNLTRGQWTAWTLIAFNDLAGVLSKSGYHVVKTTTASYLSLTSSHISDKEDVINLTYSGTSGQRFGINILSTFLTALKTKATSNGGYAKVTINIGNGVGGSYIGVKVNSSQFTGTYWGGRVTTTYNGVNICTNIPYYTTQDASKEKQAGQQGIIDIIYYIDSNNTNYLNIFYKQ